jgi:F0F1-type ATP synthase assembly protein I
MSGRTATASDEFDATASTPAEEVPRPVEESTAAADREADADAGVDGEDEGTVAGGAGDLSYSASRFGVGFIGGMLLGAVVGVATGELALAALFGFVLATLAGFLVMEFA